MQVSIERCEPGDLFRCGESMQRYIFAGPSGCGKTTAAIYALKNWISTHDEYVLVSPSSDQAIYNAIPWTRKYTSYDSTELWGEIYRAQLRKACGINKRVMIVMDDILGSAGIRGTASGAGPIETIYALGRHHNLSCMVLVQKINVISPAVRTNSSLVIFRHNSMRDVELIYNECGFSTKREFSDILGRVWGAGRRVPFCFRYEDSVSFAGWDKKLLIRFGRERAPESGHESASEEERGETAEESSLQASPTNLNENPTEPSQSESRPDNIAETNDTTDLHSAGVHDEDPE